MADFLRIFQELGTNEFKAYVTDLSIDETVMSSDELLQMACDEFYRRTGVIAKSRDKWCYGETQIYSHNNGERGCPYPTNYDIPEEV